MARRCPSCKPQRHRIDYPGGFAWRHQDTCALYPKQKVGEEKKPSTTTERSGSELNAAIRQWNHHPKIGPMTETVSHVDEHVDDELEEAES